MTICQGLHKQVTTIWMVSHSTTTMKLLSYDCIFKTYTIVPNTSKRSYFKTVSETLLKLFISTDRHEI